ncbi:MAG: YggS family pyridoxal phosphate-dependent enzyme [Acidimicrobiales bacterium]
MSAGLGAAVAERLDTIRQRIADAGGDPAQVRIVAVTKAFGADEVEAAVGAGLTELGENYAQELLAKADAVPNDVRWHFLGVPQRNKIGRLAPYVALWEAVDKRSTLDAIADRQPGAAVLMQVNLTAAPTKGGCRVEDVPGLVDHGRGLGLDVQGLMTVGPAGDRAGSERCFTALAKLGAAHGLAQLSMGMSDDYDVAVARGSTMIRIGRGLFGPRPNRREEASSMARPGGM